MTNRGNTPPTPRPENELGQQPVGEMSVVAILTLVMAERQKQRNRFDDAHDDEHTHAELINAAISYANFASLNEPARRRWMAEGIWPAGTPWPWEHRLWKPEPLARGDLIKACALLVAEIERLDRLEKSLR